MAYTGKAYMNTGFNTSNIPDSPALLEQCEQYDFTYDLEIMQNRFLDHVDITVINYETIKNTDYCRVGTWYYFVDGITMIATDVARFSLSPDFITSANGIMGFTILDGITERVHVTEDTFGKADSNDPLLTPFEPLHIESHWKKPSHGGKTYIESTISIEDTCQNHEAVSWKDSITATAAMVLVPKTVGVGSSNGNSPTTFTYQSGASESHTTKVYITDGADSSPAVNGYIGELRSLGLEQSIVNQVRIPDAYVSHSGSGAVVTGMAARTGTWPLSEFPYIGAIGTIKNNLLYYSKYLKYGLISCSGESCEFEPQDLKSPTDTDTYPTIRYVTDPHLDGKPYFRFTKVNGDSSNDGFWRNCIAGMPWKQIPLVFTQASGSALNQLKFENARGIAEGRYGIDQQMRDIKHAQDYGFTGLRQSGGVKTGLEDFVSMGLDVFSVMPSMILDPRKTLGSMLNVPKTALNQTMEDKSALYDYGSELRNQLLDIAINANVVIPTVNFPYNSHILQDQFENGVLAYRYTYTANDVARIDKLLTMYGYKFAKPLETSDFTNRQYFNFVECSNVTVTGHARWWNDGIASQLKGGVRVWHVLPNPTYYNNNPVA